ncbi:hypothetical protein LBMAG10_02510 [Actinomycetes bacterium]|nr:hypothetical protein LBMAG10_02510 [Actinomycetes bacterium]
MKSAKLLMSILFLLILMPTEAYAGATVQWNSTTELKGKINIPAGQTVTVAPNTKIVVQDGTQITINGTLNAPAGLSLTGKSWIGLVIAGTAVITNFQEKGASQSFRVDAGGFLTIHGGTISGILGSSNVEGNFVADHLRYDKGTGGGISSNDGTGSITIDNSVLVGAGKNTGDFFELFGVKSITLTNSKMTGSHCAFHVMGLKNMKLDKNEIYENSYGFMMYGSNDTGTKTITNTSIKNNEFGFDEGSASTRNGAILISNSTIKKNGQNLGLYTGKVKITSPVK